MCNACTCVLPDPNYQQPIPNLDRTEGHSEYILFGTNLDLSDDENPGSNGGTTTKAKL